MYPHYRVEYPYYRVRYPYYPVEYPYHMMTHTTMCVPPLPCGVPLLPCAVPLLSSGVPLAPCALPLLRCEGPLPYDDPYWQVCATPKGCPIRMGCRTLSAAGTPLPRGLCPPLRIHPPVSVCVFCWRGCLHWVHTCFENYRKSCRGGLEGVFALVPKVF